MPDPSSVHLDAVDSATGQNNRDPVRTRIQRVFPRFLLTAAAGRSMTLTGGDAT